MGKTTNDKKKPKQHKASSSSVTKKRAVQVVTCPSDFPPRRASNSTRKPAHDDDTATRRRVKKEKFLDWHDTSKEIRSLGATAFVGKDKREFKKQAYKELTGRELKQQRVPLPIVRGIRKKALQRQARLEQEAKEAGIVLPSLQTRKAQRKNDTTSRIHGPAPSVGFMKKGVLKVAPKRP